MLVSCSSCPSSCCRCSFCEDSFSEQDEIMDDMENELVHRDDIDEQKEMREIKNTL
jgi:hypothetical protein